MLNKISFTMIALLLTTLLTVACGPGGGGDNTHSAPPPDESVTFTSSNVAAGTALLLTSSDGTRIEVFFHGQTEQGALFRLAINDAGSGTLMTAGPTGISVYQNVLAYQGDAILIITYDVSRWSASQTGWRN